MTLVMDLERRHFARKAQSCSTDRRRRQDPAGAGNRPPWRGTYRTASACRTCPTKPCSGSRHHAIFPAVFLRGAEFMVEGRVGSPCLAPVVPPVSPAAENASRSGEDTDHSNAKTTSLGSRPPPSPRSATHIPGLRDFVHDSSPRTESISGTGQGKQRLKQHEALREMHRSGDELHACLVGKVAEFAEDCRHLTWENAFEYAQQIADWALRYCDKTEAAGMQGGKRSDARPKRIDIAYQYFDRESGQFITSEENDGHTLLIRSQRFEFQHFTTVSESLLEILSFHFKENAEKLDRDAVKRWSGLDGAKQANDSGEPGEATGDDWAAVEKYLKDKALFDRVNKFVVPPRQFPQRPDAFRQVLDQVERLPSSVADTSNMLLGPKAVHRHSFRAQALVHLAGQLDFRSGNYMSAYIDIARQADALPDRSEQAFVKRAMWPCSRGFLSLCQGGGAEDRQDPQTIRRALETLVKVLDGLEAPAPEIPDSDSTDGPVWDVESLEFEFPHMTSSDLSSESDGAPDLVISGAMPLARTSASYAAESPSQPLRPLGADALAHGGRAPALTSAGSGAARFPLPSGSRPTVTPASMPPLRPTQGALPHKARPSGAFSGVDERGKLRRQEYTEENLRSLLDEMTTLVDRLDDPERDNLPGSINSLRQRLLGNAEPEIREEA